MTLLAFVGHLEACWAGAPVVVKLVLLIVAVKLALTIALVELGSARVPHGTLLAPLEQLHVEQMQLRQWELLQRLKRQSVLL